MTISEKSQETYLSLNFNWILLHEKQLIYITPSIEIIQCKVQQDEVNSRNIAEIMWEEQYKPYKEEKLTERKSYEFNSHLKKDAGMTKS